MDSLNEFVYLLDFCHKMTIASRLTWYVLHIVPLWELIYMLSQNVNLPNGSLVNDGRSNICERVGSIIVSFSSNLESQYISV